MIKKRIIENLKNCGNFSELLELDNDLHTHFGVTVDHFIRYIDKLQLEEWAKKVIDTSGIERLVLNLKGLNIEFNYFTFDANGKFRVLDDDDLQKTKIDIAYYIGKH